ncbi:hypothetical protein [Salipiger mucosus]|uniref:Uncharacterized protein n=1 Tax=Salipiger mucosus DSM 16094 TaxID=1123237 RepID=S9S7D0_9RHOB|nr:hypothetical protein [Salipiger mucosus]EPX82099.1 hypothetical protein Salmuc_02467 [Salipiger mucosus DSM 16094]
MPSPHEAAVVALEQVLAIYSPIAVMREEELPIACPAAGLMNIRPEDPEEEDQRLGSGIREWSRLIEIECVVQADTSDRRNELLDNMLTSVAGFLLANRTLGGAVDYLQPGAPENSEVVPMEGTDSLKGAVLPVTIYYETTDNPME